MIDFLDLKTVYTILHLIGVAVGAGGAFMSDAMFFRAMKDLKLSHVELGFLRLGSRMVWMGLAILVVSGLLLFSLDVERYLHSTKFMLKMTIVAIIALNGTLFHFVHMSHLIKHAETTQPLPRRFFTESRWLFMSGAVSVISWISTIILGAMRGIPLSYGTLLSMYLFAISIGLLGALLVRERFISKTIA